MMRFETDLLDTEVVSLLNQHIGIAIQITHWKTVSGENNFSPVSNHTSF